MKRLCIVLALVMAAGSLFAQSIPSFDAYKSYIQSFATSTASSLPLESSVGLNWSDAYIGQFPHFGLGLTLGAATIPFSAVQALISNFGGSTSSLSALQSIGVPVPAYTIDLRLGGFVLPFDIGLKFGYIPQNALSSLSSVKVDYLLLGGDVRYALIKEKGIIPAISVGLGYTYMRGNVTVPNVVNGASIGNVIVNGTGGHTLSFTNPSVNFFWNTNVIDAKVQVSKNLFIITPYLGLGASYGISNTSAGIESQLQVDGSNATQSQIDSINSTYGTNYSSSNQFLGVSAGANGFSTRVFGGLSLNLFIFKLGVGMEYEFLSGSMAGMINARLQF
jgi:hypothetical protein